MAKVDEGDVKEVTMYLSPNSYELQGEFVKPANSKFRITVPKENAPEITKMLRDKDLGFYKELNQTGRIESNAPARP